MTTTAPEPDATPSPPDDDKPLLHVRGLKTYFPVKRGLLQRTVGHVTPASMGGVVLPRTSTAPAAPDTSQEQSLEELRAAFYTSAGVYRRALETGTPEEQLTARTAYRKAQERFLDARRAAGGLR